MFMYIIIVLHACNQVSSWCLIKWFDLNSISRQKIIRLVSYFFITWDMLSIVHIFIHSRKRHVGTLKYNIRRIRSSYSYLLKEILGNWWRHYYKYIYLINTKFHYMLQSINICAVNILVVLYYDTKNIVDENTLRRDNTKYYLTLVYFGVILFTLYGQDTNWR